MAKLSVNYIQEQKEYWKENMEYCFPHYTKQIALLYNIY